MWSVTTPTFDATLTPAPEHSVAGALVVVALGLSGNVGRLPGFGLMLLMNLITLALAFAIHSGTATTLSIDRCSINTVINNICNIGNYTIIVLGSYGRTIGIYLPCP